MSGGLVDWSFRLPQQLRAAHQLPGERVAHRIGQRRVSDAVERVGDGGGEPREDPYGGPSSVRSKRLTR